MTSPAHPHPRIIPRPLWWLVIGANAGMAAWLMSIERTLSMLTLAAIHLFIATLTYVFMGAD